MSEDSSSLLVDRSDHYLIGPPVTVSVVLSQATWAALIQRTIELYSMVEGQPRSFQEGIELFFDDVICDRVLRDEAEKISFDDDDYEPPF